MGAFGETSINNMLDSLFGSGTPASIKVGLSTTDPGADGSGATPPSGGSYAAVTKTNNSTNFPAASSKSKGNGTAITFPTPTAGWGVCSHFTVRDGSDAWIGGGALAASKTIDTGDLVEFAVGALTAAIS